MASIPPSNDNSKLRYSDDATVSPEEHDVDDETSELDDWEISTTDNSEYEFIKNSELVGKKTALEAASHQTAQSKNKESIISTFKTRKIPTSKIIEAFNVLVIKDRFKSRLAREFSKRPQLTFIDGKQTYRYGKSALTIHHFDIPAGKVKTELESELNKIVDDPTSKEEWEAFKSDFERGKDKFTLHFINGVKVIDFDTLNQFLSQHSSTLHRIIGQKLFAILSSLAFQLNGDDSIKINCPVKPHAYYNHVNIPNGLEVNVTLIQDAYKDTYKDDNTDEALAADPKELPYLCYELQFKLQGQEVNVTSARISYRKQGE